MISQELFEELARAHPPLRTMSEKVQDIIRDQLNPADEVKGIWSVQISGVAGVLCITQNDVIAFWTQKMFVFFKFPAVQVFHRAHLRLVQEDGLVLTMKAQADPVGAPDEYEDGRFKFPNPADLQAFMQQIGPGPAGNELH